MTDADRRELDNLVILLRTARRTMQEASMISNIFGGNVHGDIHAAATVVAMVTRHAEVTLQAAEDGGAMP